MQAGRGEMQRPHGVQLYILTAPLLLRRVRFSKAIATLDETFEPLGEVDADLHVPVFEAPARSDTDHHSRHGRSAATTVRMAPCAQSSRRRS